MHHTDLIYRRQMFGWTRRQFASRLGRSYQAVASWERGTVDMPSWLDEWLEYMDMELVCGREPERAPAQLSDIMAVLYPARHAARSNELAVRRRSGAARKALEAKRAAVRPMRVLRRINHENIKRRRPLKKG